MPSYIETVLSKNPFFFGPVHREDVSVIEDLSGNGNNGTYYAEAVKGIQSPIETDVLARAVENRVGTTLAPAPFNAFSWGCWGLYSPEIGFGAAGVLSRNGQIGTIGNHIGINGTGQMGVRLLQADDIATAFLLTYHLLSNYGWYRFLVTRSTNVIRLYVNGYLRHEITSFPIGPMSHPTYITGEGTGWKIGVTGATGNIDAGRGTGPVDLYDYALSAGDELEIYESAKLDLPLSVTIPVRVVVELDTDQVVPVNFPFTHNFAEPLSGSPRPIVEHLSWKTNLNQSEPDYQQRINAQPHHVERTLEYFITPTSPRARAMMQAALWTPGQTYTLPIANDWGVLTAEATAGANTLALDTTLRDYELGSYVVVWEDVREPWTAQFFQITSITDTELGITPDVGQTLPTGSPVMPARLAILPEDSLSLDSHLIDRETAALQFEILSTELSSRRVTAYTPSETWLGIEVFRLERAKVEWVDPSPYEISRRQEGTGISTGNDYLRAIDTGSSQTIPLRVLLTSPQAISEFYGWMDARQGKANPVWISSEEHDLEVVARFGSPGRIEINNIGYAARYNVHSARRHIVFKLADGSLNFKRITAAVDNGDTETLTLTADPPLLADIVKTSFLRLCTAPDQFELRYHRDGSRFIGECEFVVTELLTTAE